MTLDPRAAAMAAAREALRQVFGFDDFRPGQGEAVEAALAGDDAIVVMPVGGGKSLCYQLPAVVRGGLTVVVSPTRDRADRLAAMGIPAGCVDSRNPSEENRRVGRAARDGALRLLYAAPELLAQPAVSAFLKRCGVNMLAIDDAHRVSQRGRDFRPEYLQLRDLRAALGGPQTIALTATADAATCDDIEARLFDSPPRRFIMGFNHQNMDITSHPPSQEESNKPVRNLSNATPRSLTDELGDIRRKISMLKKEEKFIRQALLERIDTPEVEGSDYRVNFSIQLRKKFSLEKAKTLIDENTLAKCFVTREVRMLRTAKRSDE